MGYEVTRFAREIDEVFRCSICSMVLKDPMQSPCEHLFCDDCIKGWLEMDESCPVDHGILKLEDLKPASRAVRNFVNKSQIRCDFESKGCQVLVRLEDLRDHVIRCEYNENKKVICDKGCNIEMDLEEYESKNCFKHLADQAVRQQETILKLKEDLCDLRRQTGLASKLGSAIWNESKVVVKKRPKFRVLLGNVKSSSDPNVWEFEEGWGCTQSIKPTLFSFQFEILSLGAFVNIGLGPRCPSRDSPIFTLYCGSNGWSNFNGKFEKVGPAWKVGDIIECGINFPSDYVDDGRDVCAYFHKNGELIIEGFVTMPMDGLFPTVYMHGSSKVKYLNE